MHKKRSYTQDIHMWISSYFVALLMLCTILTGPTTITIFIIINIIYSGGIS